MFLLPDELKNRYNTLKDIVNDKPLLNGDFDLTAPKSNFGFKCEI
jgi:hypothetical protein